MYQAVGSMFLGWALGEEGHLEEASKVLERGLADFCATGAILVRPFYFALIAEACVRRGDVMRARGLVEEAISAAEASGERIHLADLHRMLGDFMAQDRPSNDHTGLATSAVEQQYRLALQIAREQGAVSLELRAATSLARWWRRLNRIREAHTLLQGCYARFSEGFATADLRDAMKLLEETADR
jgi:predicted ATPase